VSVSRQVHSPFQTEFLCYTVTAAQRRCLTTRRKRNWLLVHSHTSSASGSRWDGEHIASTRNYKKYCEELIAYVPSYDTSHNKNDPSNNSSIVACVFVTAATFLPSSCLATIGGFLPSRCLATMVGIHRHTHTRRVERDVLSLLYFFKIKKVV
jgi:hypothetical protein